MKGGLSHYHQLSGKYDKMREITLGVSGKTEANTDYPRTQVILNTSTSVLLFVVLAFRNQVENFT